MSAPNISIFLNHFFTLTLFHDTYARRMGQKKPAFKSLPRVRCDFNSAGWSGEDDDPCYYSFDEQSLARSRPRPGKRVFIFEDSRDGLVMGCEAELESYTHPLTGEPRWRLRPVENTGYFGEMV